MRARQCHEVRIGLEYEAEKDRTKGTRNDAYVSGAVGYTLNDEDDFTCAHIKAGLKYGISPSCEWEAASGNRFNRRIEHKR